MASSAFPPLFLSPWSLDAASSCLLHPGAQHHNSRILHPGAQHPDSRILHPGAQHHDSRILHQKLNTISPVCLEWVLTKPVGSYSRPLMNSLIFCGFEARWAMCACYFSWHKRRTMKWTVLGASIISRKYLMVYDEWAYAKWIKNEFILQTNLRIVWQGSGDSLFLSLSTVPCLFVCELMLSVRLLV